MITKTVEAEVNQQIRREELSSRLYLSMASWCQVNGYQGAAQFLYAQSDEEREHQLKFIHYLDDRGGMTKLLEIEKPALKFKSLIEIFRQVLEHEEYISASINNLYGLAVEEKDFTTGNFLQWFINEQVEEESVSRQIIDKIKLAGDEKGGLFMIDKELGEMASSKRTAELVGMNGSS
jgi:ferritin